jgi:MFS family permease
MMTADDVIQFYVRDVASYLPRNKRNDVAFELRALLQDELAAKAAAQGRAPDREMAMDLLSGFGRPAEAAARYQPRAPLIDPADNHSFLIWAVVGAIVFSVANPQSRWAYLQWVGGVFIVFAVLAWLRRRQTGERLLWRPRRDHFPEVASRPLVLLAGLATLVFPFAMYLAPRTWWEVATFGTGISSGLALTEAFLQSWQRAVTLAGLALIVVIYATVAAQGGWRFWSRRALITANLLVGGMLVAHAAPMITLLGRQTFMIFQSQTANRVAMPIFGLAGGLMVLASLYDVYKEWARVSPAPALHGTGTA